MAYLIGTDEAGYGPNLGPLVIAGSVWRVPEGDVEPDLYEALEAWVTRHATLEPYRLAIADSKQLYHPGGDLAQLERGLMTLLALGSGPPATWYELGRRVGTPISDPTRSLPWQPDADFPLPVTAAGGVDGPLIERGRHVLRAAGVSLVALRAVVVDPPEFNDGVTRYDSKGTLLSHRTLDLVAHLLSGLESEPVRIVCDKHGGRNRYGPLLQPRFQDRLVRVVCEGRQASVYEVGTSQRPVRIGFHAGGESFLPSALASMLAKYLRELSMLAFNTFWQRQLPDLRPTAGYPQDAKRFHAQIRPLQRRLGIADQWLWRCR